MERKIGLIPVHITSISVWRSFPSVFKYSDLLTVGNALVLQYSTQKKKFGKNYKLKLRID